MTRDQAPQLNPQEARPTSAGPWRYRTRSRWRRLLSLRRAPVFNTLFGALFILGATFLVLPPGPPRPAGLRIGDIAPRTYRAPSDQLIRDEEVIGHRMEEAAGLTRPVYDLDPGVAVRLSSALDGLVREGRGVAGERGGEGGIERVEALRQAVHRKVGIDLSSQTLLALSQEGFAEADRKTLQGMLGEVLERGLTADPSPLRRSRHGIVIRTVADPPREEIVLDPGEILDPSRAREFLSRRAAELIPAGRLREAVIPLAQGLLQPNLRFDAVATDRAMERNSAAAPPVFLHVKAGEIILREGEPVTGEQLMKLRQIFPENAPYRLGRRLGGYLLLNTLVMILMWTFLTGYHPAVLRSRRDLGLLLTLFFLTLAVTRVSVELAKPVSATFPALRVESLYYGMPVTFAPWLTAMLVSIPAAFLMSLVCAFYAVFIIGGGAGYLLSFIAASLLAAYLGARCHQRSTFFRIGLYLGTLNAGFVVAQELARPDADLTGILQAALFALASGPAAALVVSGTLPVMEYLFHKTTDIKLLELTNPMQPLLKRLVMEAPGTYHHSIIVGNLAETAAEAVGANPLLARVSAYFHDIGKIRKPDYFIENNPEGRSRHEPLAPRMSSLILTAHVKEGMELAREYRLPEVVIEAIRQHHGTSLITYFYHKAKEQEDLALERVNENEYRYPGPKPGTRENAIIMLADQIEAACRALADPTPPRIEGEVARIAGNLSQDGQLDECDLTFHDLDLIRGQFTRVLVGMYHQRVDYPLMVNGKLMEETCPGDKKPAKERKH